MAEGNGITEIFGPAAEGDQPWGLTGKFGATVARANSVQISDGMTPGQNNIYGAPAAGA